MTFGRRRLLGGSERRQQAGLQAETARAQLKAALPKGMELSHFSVLNHFAHLGGEKTPAQLARIFHVTKGAMTNTLTRLSASGYIHIRPDWDSNVPSPSARIAQANRTSAFSEALEEKASEEITILNLSSWPSLR